MSQLPNCPNCDSKYVYEDGLMLVCPECFHEWNPEVMIEKEPIIKDAFGNILSDGDNVSIVQDLKVKGSQAIKRGTIVKNIRLIHDPADGVHDIDCKVDGYGPMFLKSSVVKKL